MNSSSPLRSNSSNAAAASPENRIHLHSTSLFVDLVQSTSPKPASKSVSSSGKTSVSREQRLREVLTAKKEARRIEHEAEDLRYKQELARTRKESARKRESRFNDRYRQILEEQQDFVRRVNEFLTLKQQTDTAKRDKLFSEWEEKVFHPVQKYIGDQIDSLPVAEMESRRREMFAEFLHQTNTKDGLFRDIIIEHEYNPLRARDYHIKYDATSDLHDPTLKPMVRKQAEDTLATVEKNSSARKNSSSSSSSSGGGATVPGGSFARFSSDVSRKTSRAAKTTAAAHGPGVAEALYVRAAKSRQRDVLDVRQWDKVEGTPYGRYSQLVSDNHESKSSSPVDGKTSSTLLRKQNLNKSSVCMDHYNIATGREALQPEIPKGKRTFYSRPPAQ